MSAYKFTIKGAIPFDGEQVAYELRRITFEDALAMRNARKADESLLGKASLDALRAYVVRLDVKDADGGTVPLEAVFRDFYFAALVSELIVKLLETGSIADAARDPSAGNSSPSSADAGSLAATG